MDRRVGILADVGCFARKCIVAKAGGSFEPRCVGVPVRCSLPVLGVTVRHFGNTRGRPATADAFSSMEGCPLYMRSIHIPFERCVRVKTFENKSVGHAVLSQDSYAPRNLCFTRSVPWFACIPDPDSGHLANAGCIASIASGTGLSRRALLWRVFFEFCDDGLALFPLAFT